MRRRFWSPFEAYCTKRLTHVEGLEHVPLQQPFIVAANHIDWLDGIMLLVALDKKIPYVPIRYVARVKSYQMLGSYTIPIDPENRNGAMHEAEKHLTQNGVIGFFPEGKRNPSPRLLPGKTGCVRMAMRTGLPVLPMGIRGKSHTSFISALWQLPSILRNTEVHIGEPLQIPTMKDEEISYAILQKHTRALMERLAQLSNKEIPDYATHP